MIYFLSKIIFLIKKPKVIVVSGSFREASFDSICWCLRYCGHSLIKIDDLNRNSLTKANLSSFFGNKIIVVNSKIKDLDYVNWILRKSKLPILILGKIKEGEIKEESEKISKTITSLPSFGCFAINADDEKLEIFLKNAKSKIVTFGFEEKSDFKVTNVNLTEDPSFGTNFKLNFKGMIIPVWLDGLFGREQVYASLSSIVAGFFLNFNLIKISESIRNYRGIEGKMRLIKGVKRTYILDNSRSSYSDSVLESIEILKEIPFEGRKVFIFGSLVSEGNLIEVYEEIGRKISSGDVILIVFGSGPKIISEKTSEKGLSVEKIFEFDTIDQGKLKVQQIIKKEDLILVAGSRETNTSEIIDEIKKI